MTYTTKWLRDGKVIDTAQFEKRGKAMEEAVSRFPAMAHMFGATAAEVWDDDGLRHLLHTAEKIHN